MKLSDPVKQTIILFTARYPMPVGEDNLRLWVHRLCEQLAYTFPSEGWSHKGAPHSKDAIARGRLAWDIILGAGTTTPRLNLEAESEDITGQPLEPVTPRNWLDDTPPPPPPPVDPCPCDEKLAAILAELVGIRADLAKAAGSLAELPALVKDGIKIRF